MTGRTASPLSLMLRTASRRNPSCDALRVVMFNTDTDRAEDVSHAIAQEILRRLNLEGRHVLSALEDFIDCHVGPDRQLTLRLAAV
jgi:hypothetical protein